MSLHDDAPLRVLIVDDHDLFRTGLASLISAEADLEVAAQASGGRMAVRLARELRPDVVLMDLRMPDLGGEDATREILAEDPDARVVILTVIADADSVAGAVRAGACGYLVKDSPIDEIINAARAAAIGSAWLSSRAASAVLEHLRAEVPEPELADGVLESLSAREIEVLRLLARGLENIEIASELGISSLTAKGHVSSILTKLDVSNRVQAAVFAVEHHLV